MDTNNMGIRPSDAQSPPGSIISEPHQSKQSFGAGMWHKISHFLGKEDRAESPGGSGLRDDSAHDANPSNDNGRPRCSSDATDGQWSTRKVGIGLPRQTTFRRQNSERRERLLPVEPDPAERRGISVARNQSANVYRPRSKSSPPPYNPGSASAPSVTQTASILEPSPRIDIIDANPEQYLSRSPDDVSECEEDRPSRPLSRTSSINSRYDQFPNPDDRGELNAELDSKWILNLSMHFRDKSEREKFFVTYAETPTKWRRVTVSCDYRDAEPGSLEMDLKELQFQRDKSLQIYASIRDSLPEIQFYNTVTNLKLETSEGRLHVHVTEDQNEIIPYPPRDSVSHILQDLKHAPIEVREDDIRFDSHLSGFVYKVTHKGKVYIKKEIPGPDTVDEFLYEINALHALCNSEHVIKLEGIVLDNTGEFVKGLLINYAERGAVVDLLYDCRGSIPWEERSKWACQVIRGLSEIHEEGYVQGDFTLSNIVIDEENNAKIIDINRRGCPVGWEPPEIAVKIARHQRISMYIGEKSDLYQLGMTLWALAMDDDEPERHDPPLSVEEFPSEIPDWYQCIVRICLAERPRDRLSAKELIGMFPEESNSHSSINRDARPLLALCAEKKYIDPAAAVERDDIERLAPIEARDMIPYSPESSRDDYTFTYPRSSNYEKDSASSAFERPRGRLPPTNVAHLNREERHHWSLEDQILHEDPANEEPRILTISPDTLCEYDELNLDGRPYLIPRNTFSGEELEILERGIDTERLERRHSIDDDPSAARSGANEDDSSDETRPTRPKLLTRTSETSESTPRNSHLLLPIQARDLSSMIAANSISNQPVDQVPQSCIPDINPIDSNRILHNDNTYSNSSNPSARLPYADSGYDEPLIFGDLRSNLLPEGQASHSD